MLEVILARALSPRGAILLACGALGLTGACGPGPLPDARALAVEALDRLDADGDGAVTEAEWTRLDGAPGAFARVDSDGDGRVDPGEFDRYVEATEPRTPTLR